MDNWKAELERLRRRLSEKLEEGGEGSGNFGHAGRPGEVGGSAPGGGGGASYTPARDDIYYDDLEPGDLSPKNNTYELPSGDCFTAVDSKDKGVLKFTRFLGRATGEYQSRNAGGGPHYELLTKRFREWKIGYDTYSYTDKKTGDVFVVRTTQRKDGANRYLITRGK